MSCSPESPWSAFAERSEPIPEPASTPATELVAALAACEEILDAARAGAKETERRCYDALAELAVAAEKLARALAEATPALQEKGLGRVQARLQMLIGAQRAVFPRLGVTAPDPTGKAWDAVADQVTVASWREDPRFVAEVVDEVLEPPVLRDGRLLRRGNVVMGCPSSSSGTQSGAGDAPGRDGGV